MQSLRKVHQHHTDRAAPNASYGRVGHSAGPREHRVAAQDARRTHRLGSVTRVDLEFASCDLLQPARYATHDRLLAQVSTPLLQAHARASTEFPLAVRCQQQPPRQVAGRRRVLLMAPTLTFDGLYPFPVAHPYDRYAMPDLERPDPAAWPALARARGRVALLRPGDVLFLPAFWHATRAGPQLPQISCLHS